MSKHTRKNNKKKNKHKKNKRKMSRKTAVKLYRKINDLADILSSVSIQKKVVKEEKIEDILSLLTI